MRVFCADNEHEAGLSPGRVTVKLKTLPRVLRLTGLKPSVSGSDKAPVVSPLSGFPCQTKSGPVCQSSYSGSVLVSSTGDMDG